MNMKTKKEKRFNG